MYEKETNVHPLGVFFRAVSSLVCVNYILARRPGTGSEKKKNEYDYRGGKKRRKKSTRFPLKHLVAAAAAFKPFSGVCQSHATLAYRRAQ